MSQSQRRAFFWLYVAPSGVAGGIWGAAPLPPLVLALIIVALAAGQIWMVRTQLIHALFRWAADPIISFSILLIGGIFAVIGYAFVRIAFGPGIPLNWPTTAGRTDSTRPGMVWYDLERGGQPRTG